MSVGPRMPQRLAWARGRGRQRWRTRGRWRECPWGREGDTRFRDSDAGDDIPFRIHTLEIGAVILGLACRGSGSGLALRRGPAPFLLDLEDVHRLTDRRE